MELPLESVALYALKLAYYVALQDMQQGALTVLALGLIATVAPLAA